MGEMVSFPSNGSEASGYLATTSSTPAAGVIVIQEWWGLVPHIKRVVDRFAAEGFLALAPDLFHGRQTTEPDEADKLLMGLEVGRAGREIAGAAAYLAEREDCTGRIGVVGFCAGGTIALWSATLSDAIHAAVGFYPFPFRSWEALNTDWDKYAGKFAMIHAAEGDGGSQAPGVQQARNAIEAAGGELEVFDYPGTQHAFFNDDRSEVHHPEAAHLAWERTVDLFRSTLVA